MERQGVAETGAEEVLQLVSFIVGGEEFGVSILKVQEINRTVSMTRVPNMPASMDGVVNLRGKVIPIINLRYKFGMERKPFDKDTRIVVAEVNGSSTGFVVDAVREVLRIPRKVTEPPPQMVGGLDTRGITAIGKLSDRLLILLDLERVVSSEDKQYIEDGAWQEGEHAAEEPATAAV